MDSRPLARRTFLATCTATAMGAILERRARAENPLPKLKLGYDNFAVRAMGWKALQLLDHAAELKCDTLFISDLEAFDSLDDQHLQEVRKRADGLGIGLYAGSWSICPTSGSFKSKWGTAEEHLATGIRVSK